MRLGTDALINGNPTSRAQVRKISIWIKQKTLGNPANIRAGYNLDGSFRADSDYFSTFFVSPFGAWPLCSYQASKTGLTKFITGLGMCLKTIMLTL